MGGIAKFTAMLDYEDRRWTLLVLSGLVVGYTRHFASHGDYTFGGSWGTLFGSWLIHYFVLAFLAGISRYFIVELQSIFFEPKERLPVPSLNQFIYIVSVIALVYCVAYFIILHWPLSYDGDRDW